MISYLHHKQVLVLIVQQPKKHTRGDKRGNATMKGVALRSRDTSKAQSKQAQDCSIYRCTKITLGLLLKFSFFYTTFYFSFGQLFLDTFPFAILLFFIDNTRPTTKYDTKSPKSSLLERKLVSIGKFLHLCSRLAVAKGFGKVQIGHTL